MLRTDEYTRDQDAGFTDWMHEVDKACERLTGLSIMDLTDHCYRDWYEDGMTAVAAARCAIRMENGGDEYDDDADE